jgi:hypothetical protein
LNQALRHLWTKAYQLPILEPSSSSPSQPGKGSLEREYVSKTMSISGTSGHRARPRILIAKPKRSKPAIALGPQESLKNQRIVEGLSRIFGADKMNAVLAQANSIFHVNNPLADVNPEPYELFENGQIDEALEYFGTSWNIGRPSLA